MTIKLARNCIKSGTAGSCCSWFPLSPLNNFNSFFTSDDISECLQLGTELPSLGPALLIVNTLQVVARTYCEQWCYCGHGDRSWRYKDPSPWYFSMKLPLEEVDILSHSVSSSEPKRTPCLVFQELPLTNAIISFCGVFSLHNGFGFYYRSLLSLQHAFLSW